MALPKTKEEAIERLHAVEQRIAKKKVIGPAYGLAKGLSVTLRTMMRRSITVQYPHTMPDLPPRSRGVIAFKEENCTVCMLCSRECPDWCIYIESHKEVVPPKTPGARARTRNILDRFAIDFSLCMYCGICVEVCPFDALFWSPHFEYSETDISNLIHETPVLTQWMDHVYPPPELEVGAEPPPEASAETKIYETAGVLAVSAPAPPGSADAPAGVHPSGGESPAGTSAPPAAAATAVVDAAPAVAATPSVSEGGDHGPPEVDQEVYQRELAAGKPERVARALAKRAWVVKRRQGGA